MVDYDEFAGLPDVAAELGRPGIRIPPVERRFVEVAPGRQVSALVWGEGPPELVFLHGGGQNAHTWDAVALALGRPAVAIDLPGHGWSSWRADRDYMPWANAEALATALPLIAPHAKAVIGMSLGGATAIRLAAERPDLVRRVVIVDVTPQVNDPARAMSLADRGAVALVSGPQVYEDFESMAAAAIALSPRRLPEAVRRGVRHNAQRLPDGRWSWRYDLFGPRPGVDFTALWQDVSRIAMPAMLVIGGASRHVSPEDSREMQRRLPALRIETVEGAGHAVQSDAPLVLAGLIDDFVFADERSGSA